jgi:hypothetical protein
MKIEKIKIKFFIYYPFIALMFFFMSSCVGIGMLPTSSYLNDNTYLNKEVITKKDSSNYKSAVYVSGKVNLLSQNSPQSNEDKVGQGFSNQISTYTLQIHHANSWKYFNLAYGIQASLGNSSTKNHNNFNLMNSLVPRQEGINSFQNLTYNIEGNMKIPFDDWEWRVLGVVFNYSKESGDYLNLRRQINPNQIIQHSRSDFSYSYGLTSEICHKISPKKTFFTKISFIDSYIPEFTYYHNLISSSKGTFNTRHLFFYMGFEIDNFSANVYTSRQISIERSFDAIGTYNTIMGFGLAYKLSSIWKK